MADLPEPKRDTACFSNRQWFVNDCAFSTKEDAKEAINLVNRCFCLFSHEWFTDRQIEDMVKLEIEDWRRHVRLAVRNRKVMAAREKDVRLCDVPGAGHHPLD